LTAGMALPVPAGAPPWTADAATSDEVNWKQIKFAIRDAQRVASQTGASEPGSAVLGGFLSSDTGSSASADGNIPGGMSSGSSSSLDTRMMQTSLASMLIPSVVLAALSEDKRRILENTMGAMLSSTGTELAALQALADGSSERVLADQASFKELQAKFDKLSLEHEAKEFLRDQLATSRLAANVAQDERDALSDKLAGVHALLEVRTARHDKEAADLKAEYRSSVLKNSEAQVVMEKRVEELLAAAKKKDEKSVKDKIAADKERDGRRQKNLIRESASEVEMSHLHSELKAARRELTRLSGEAGDSSRDFEEQRMLEESLRDSQEQNARLGRDLAAMRLQLLSAQSSNDDEIADPEVPAPARTVALPGTRRLPKSLPKLKAIDEEDGMDIASQAASDISGNVSTTGEGEFVGELKDLAGLSPSRHDPAGSPSQPVGSAMSSQAEDLRKELLDSEHLFRQLADEKTAVDAEHVARIARLLENMEGFREEAAACRDLVDRMKLSDAEKDIARAAEVAEAARISGADNQAELQMLQTQVSRLAQAVEDRDRQLALANEAKRLTSIRLQDMKREMEAMEARHQKAMQDLEARLALSSKDPLHSQDAGDEIWSRLVSAEEDSNMMRNELECQTVRWQSQIEMQQQQCAVVEAKLAEEHKLSAFHKDRGNAMEERLRQAHEALDARGASLRELEAKLAAREAGTGGGQGVGAGIEVGVSLFSLLRCPARARALTPSAPVGAAVPCQSIVWQILSMMSGVMAVFCTGEDLTIQDASRHAFSIWGSSGLRGASFLSLIFDDAAREWIRNEMRFPICGAAAAGNSGGVTAARGVNASNATAPEFLLRQLGCIEFRNRLGSCFDSSVFYARLPADCAHSEVTNGPCVKPPAWVFVIEPLEQDEQGPSHGGVVHEPTGLHCGPSNLRGQNTNGAQAGALRQGGPETHRRRAASIASVSSVRSDDINANDSISNVNAY